MGVSRPAFISLVDMAASKDPDNTINALRRLQGQDQLNELAKLAGGITQTEARASREAAKGSLRGITAPMRQQALSDAGLAGKYAPGLETDVSRFQGAATGKVEDVRRLESAKATAGARAGKEATQPQVLMGQRPDRSERLMEMVNNAERYSAKSADESLLFGDAARFAQYQLDSLAAEGLKPLRPADFIGKVRELGKLDEMAGNDQFEAALSKVVKDIQKWTNEGGVISPDALYALRKNSVNSAIQTLFKDPDAPAARQVAAGVLSKIKPIIDDAIEAAGGRGWRDYLSTYSRWAQEVDANKLASAAQQMWKTDKPGFIKLVQGESPDVVEGIMGKGNYDIAKNLSNEAMATLRSEAQKAMTNLTVGQQATAGRQALQQVLSDNTRWFRLPNTLSTKTAIINDALGELEGRVGKNAMNLITEASQSPEKLKDLLMFVPKGDRVKIGSILNNPSSWGPKGRALSNAIGQTALPNQENQ